MTAYSPGFQLGQARVFSYTSDTAYSSESTVHEVNHEEPRHMPEYSPHLSSTPSAPDPDHTCYANDSSCRSIRDDKDETYGLHYYYGKLWDSEEMAEREKAISPWTITSSSNWTTTAHHAMHSPLLPGAHIHIAPPNQAVHAFNGQIPSHEEVYSAPRIDVGVETPFSNTSRVLPCSDEIDSSSFGFPLFRLPPSPRFLRSLKIDPTLAAHQRVPPEKISTYSELSPNIEFMERLKLEEAYNPIRSPTPTEAPAAPQPPITTTQNQGPIPQPDVTTAVACTDTEKRASSKSASRPASGSKSRPSASASTSQSSTSSKKRRRRKSTVDEIKAPVSSSSTASAEELSGFTKSDSRKPSLACTFCRERKISCGRPPPGSTDNTCNQCARRSFKCIYLAETGSSKSSSSRRRS